MTAVIQDKYVTFQHIKESPWCTVLIIRIIASDYQYYCEINCVRIIHKKPLR